MPSRAFDADDLIDAVDSVLRSGESFDVGLVLGSGRARVGSEELARCLRGASGRVTLDLPDSGPVVVTYGTRRFELEAERQTV